MVSLQIRTPFTDEEPGSPFLELSKAGIGLDFVSAENLI